MNKNLIIDVIRMGLSIVLLILSVLIVYFKEDILVSMVLVLLVLLLFDTIRIGELKDYVKALKGDSNE